MLYAALHVSGVDEEFALAAVDDDSPTAAQSADDGLTIFFSSTRTRDHARQALLAAFPDAAVTAIEVDDEDWARRSQTALGPIVVERLTVKPGDSDRTAETATAQRPGAPGPIEVVVEPSMGFGTGHHATTRLCLAALHRLERGGQLAGRTMLDVGTGSGILALAARALGASRALGLDYDPDAIASARGNLPLNPNLDQVVFRQLDLTAEPLPTADVVAANLTGALLCRTAPRLAGAVARGGALILSGVLVSERDDVVKAFAALSLTWEAREDEWVAFCFNPTAAGSV